MQEKTAHSSAAQANQPEITALQVPTAPDKRSRFLWIFEVVFVIAVSALVCDANTEMLTRLVLPPSSNYAWHLDYLAYFNDAISHADNWWTAVLTTWIWPTLYPPSSYLVTYLYCRVIGNGIVPALASLTVFIPVTIAAIYLIVRLRGGVIAAMAAVLAACSIPEGLLCCPQYPSDFQVGCGACISLCALFYCDVFRRRWMSLLFGIVLGYSLLFKPNVAWFVAPALAVLLLARWRDWLKAPWSTLWHLCLFSGAFVACIYLVTTLPRDLHAEMVACSTFISPSVQKIMWCVTSTVVVWWLLALVRFRKLRYVPMLTNLSHALALTFLMTMPWMIVNLNMVDGQYHALTDILISHFHTDYLKDCAITIYNSSFGAFFLGLFGLSLIFAATRWADAYDRALACSAVFGFIATAGFLFLCSRYFLPCYFVSACCLAMPLRKSKLLGYLVIVAGGLGLMSCVVLPAYPNLGNNSPNRSLHYVLDNVLVSRSYNSGDKPNECLFAQVWQICPALANPDGTPRLVILRQDERRISPYESPDDFGFDLIEDAYHAINTWACWHNSRLIPIYMRDREPYYFVDASAYIQHLKTARSLAPELEYLLRRHITCHNQSETVTTRRALLGKCSHFIDISTKRVPGLSEEQVSQLMHCSQLTHYKIQSEHCTIQLWSRPQEAPRADEMRQKANLLVPYLDSFNADADTPR